MDPNYAAKIRQLVGDKINTLVLRPYEARLEFEGGATILVEYRMELSAPAPVCIFPSISGEWNPRTVFEKKVTSVDFEGNDMVLLLEDDVRIRVSSTPQFESYHFEKDGDVITV